MNKLLDKLQLGLLAKELALFSAVILLGLFASIQYYSAIVIEKLETGFSVGWFIGSLTVAVIVMLLIIKFVKSRIPFLFLMSMVLFIGSIYVFNAFIGLIYSLGASAALVGLYWLVRNIMVHNLVIIIAIAGVSIYLGLLLPAMAVLILLALLSVYDIIAVFKTKHMITMFKGMASKGAMLSLIIPHGKETHRKKVKDIKLGANSADCGVVILGTGDAAFPAILAVASYPEGLLVSALVGIGALLGMIAVHFILMKADRPLPALPPIAFGAVLGYLIGILI